MLQAFFLTFTAIFVTLDIIVTMRVYIGMTRDLVQHDDEKPPH